MIWASIDHADHVFDNGAEAGSCSGYERTRTESTYASTKIVASLRPVITMPIWVITMRRSR